MLLSKPSCIVHWSSLTFNLWTESLRVEMITFHSQLALKLDATHSSALSRVQLHPEATNLYLTWNRQTSPAVEKYLRNNTWMTKDLRLQSQWECRQRKTYERTGTLRWVQGPEIWDCHLHTDLLWAHNDSAFLFFTIVVMSLSIRLLYSDTGRFASLLPHYGVMLGSIRKVTQGSCCWKHYLGSLFLALCRKVATPGIWCMHVYVSWKRSGYCTVLHFSRPPSSFSLCVRLHWSCQDLPCSHAP